MTGEGQKKVECQAALQAIKAQYIKAGPGSCNNVYLLDSYLNEGNIFRGAFVTELDGGVACYLDRDTHYQLILSVVAKCEYCLPQMDKEVCCEWIAYSDGCLEQTEQFQTLLRANGFKQIGVFQELRYCAGQLHAEAKAQLQSERAYLKRLGMSLEPARPESKEEIERLIFTEIGKYDRLTFGETEWLNQIACGNVTAIYHKEELAAFDLFQPSGSRFVVKPSFRGKRLGHIVKIAFLAEERWEHAGQWQREWVAVGNTPSQKTMQKLGYSQTNRSRYRFIRYPEVEE